MQRKLNLKVGQEVITIKENNSYLRETEGITLDNIDKWTIKRAVAKVGRKYITLDNGDRYEIKYDYRKIDYRGLSSKLYVTYEELKEEKEFNNMVDEISQYFSSYRNWEAKLSKNQIERIYNILQEK